MTRHPWTNILLLGFKELRSLWADKVLLVLIVWAFSGAIYEAATGHSQELRNAPVAIVDQDRSPLSRQLGDALLEPFFRKPEHIGVADVDAAMNQGRYSFVIVIPPNFQRDLAAGRRPEIQLNIDATVMSQAFIGASYIENTFAAEIVRFVHGRETAAATPIRLASRVLFNPNLTGYWFGGVMEVVNNVTMLTIILVGAAYIREREHGTLEHLLVMPITPFQIVMAKIVANGLAVLVGAAFAIMVVVQRILEVPIAGSVPLFLFGAGLYLYAAASLGIYLGSVARSMPQFGLLVILTVVPLQLLSGGVTPRESMPESIRDIMLAAPTTWFVKLAQSILFRGAGLDLVWPDFLAMASIGAVFFLLSLARFRRALARYQG